MIDKENEVYTRCAQAIRTRFPEADITGLYVNEPSQFPHVSIIMRDNAEDNDYADSSLKENVVSMMFEVNVYSNKKDTPKTEAKAIMAVISDTMRHMNFERIAYTPVDNLARGDTGNSTSNNNGALYRLFARFEGRASKEFFMR